MWLEIGEVSLMLMKLNYKRNGSKLATIVRVRKKQKEQRGKNKKDIGKCKKAEEKCKIRPALTKKLGFK